MKILMTNNALDGFGGSEIFSYLIAKKLVELWHTVHIIPYHYREETFLIKKLREAKINVLTGTDELKENYDVIHCHHNNITNLINHFYPDTPKIFVSHGRYFPVCIPNKDIQFKKIVCVSEEVKSFLKQPAFYNGIPFEIINNPIDFDRFGFIDLELPEKPQKICVSSNHAGKPCKMAEIGEKYRADGDEFWCEERSKFQNKYFLDFCFNICKRKPLNFALKLNKVVNGIPFNVGGMMFVDKEGKISSKNNQVWDVEKAYAGAHLVIGIGRSALQAMAMGIPTLVYDHFGYVGFIDSYEKFKEAQKTNFSGRISGKTIGSFPELKTYKILKEYKNIRKEWLKELSDIVKEEYDLNVVTNKFLSSYVDALGVVKWFLRICKASLIK